MCNEISTNADFYFLRRASMTRVAGSEPGAGTPFPSPLTELAIAPQTAPQTGAQPPPTAEQVRTSQAASGVGGINYYDPDDKTEKPTLGQQMQNKAVQQANQNGGGCLGGVFSFITSVLMPILAPVFSFITPLATFVSSTLSPVVGAINTVKDLFAGGDRQQQSNGGGGGAADPSATRNADAARTSENIANSEKRAKQNTLGVIEGLREWHRQQGIEQSSLPAPSSNSTSGQSPGTPVQTPGTPTTASTA
jgi:hypothetical protein